LKASSAFIVLGLVLTTNLACTVPSISPPENNKTWLKPGKIRIDNLVRGHSIKQKISIHNGNTTLKAFIIYYRTPDYVEDGFSTAPNDAPEWVSIKDNSPEIAAGETRTIEIELDLPKDAQTPEHWEFWVGVRENKASSLTTELCSRWLITMKAN
jgi:hypothetical protein